jgi:hypothetical protein
VTLPAPEPGLVIRYAYLWLREHQAGREEGVKDRPCALVLAITEESGDRRVTVVPITHTPPDDLSTVIELPAATKARLGLDADRSWIVLTEGNEFLWPGPDLRPVPGSDPSSVTYGPLPPRLFDIVRERFLALMHQRNAQRAARTE